MDLTPISLYDFPDVTAPLHLKLSHLFVIKPGRKIKFLCITRNFFDYIPFDLEENKLYRPEEIFMQGYIIEYEHIENIRGKVRWWSGEELTFGDEWTDFDWDVEQSPNFWDGESKELRVGFQGPVIALELLKLCPPIYIFKPLWDTQNTTFSLEREALNFYKND